MNTVWKNSCFYSNCTISSVLLLRQITHTVKVIALISTCVIKYEGHQTAGHIKNLSADCQVKFCWNFGMDAGFREKMVNYVNRILYITLWNYLFINVL